MLRILDLLMKIFSDKLLLNFDFSLDLIKQLNLYTFLILWGLGVWCLFVFIHMWFTLKYGSTLLIFTFIAIFSLARTLSNVSYSFWQTSLQLQLHSKIYNIFLQVYYLQYFKT